MQRFQNWQFDSLSFLIGLLVGLIVAYGFLRLLPWLRRRFAKITGWMRERISYLRSGVSTRFSTETAVYANSQHLLSHKTGLDTLFVAPRLLAPSEDPSLLPENRGGHPVCYPLARMGKRDWAP